MSVFVTLRYCQTNSPEAIKEADRFTQSIPRIQACTQECHIRVRVRVSVRVRVGVGVAVRVRVRVRC